MLVCRSCNACMSRAKGCMELYVEGKRLHGMLACRGPTVAYQASFFSCSKHLPVSERICVCMYVVAHLATATIGEAAAHTPRRQVHMTVTEVLHAPLIVTTCSLHVLHCTQSCATPTLCICLTCSLRRRVRETRVRETRERERERERKPEREKQRKRESQRDSERQPDRERARARESERHAKIFATSVAFSFSSSLTSALLLSLARLCACSLLFSGYADSGHGASSGAPRDAYRGASGGEGYRAPPSGYVSLSHCLLVPFPTVATVECALSWSVALASQHPRANWMQDVGQDSLFCLHLPNCHLFPCERPKCDSCSIYVFICIRICTYT